MFLLNLEQNIRIPVVDLFHTARKGLGACQALAGLSRRIGKGQQGQDQQGAGSRCAEHPGIPKKSFHGAYLLAAEKTTYGLDAGTAGKVEGTGKKTPPGVGGDGRSDRMNGF